MIEYLKRPSPLINTSAARWILILSVSTFIFLFLWAFQPFGLYTHFVISEVKASLGYAIITFILLTMYVLGWNKLLARYYGQRWTIGRHLLAIFLSISLIGLANGVYSNSILSENYLYESSTLELYARMFVYTHAVGLFPVILIFLIFEVRERNYYVQQSDLIESKDATFQGFNEKIEILGNGTDEKLNVNRDDFLFAKASGNYVEVFYKNEEGIGKEIFRLTLSGLMQQLTLDSIWIFQTHRSYVVNVYSIYEVDGNAQGYDLTLHHIDEKIPVARGKIQAFNDVMNGL